MGGSPESIASVIIEKECRVIAEVGVASCNFCQQLLELLLKEENHRLTEYYLIDPWQYGYECGSFGGPEMPDAKWDSLHEGALRLAMKSGNEFLKVMRLTSVQAAKLFPPAYLDLVYIDADHTYESVIEDCTVWEPKVKPDGGVLSGHDFSGGWQAVVDAVNDYFIKRAGKEGKVKWFHDIDDKHYRMDGNVWVVEL